MVKKNHLKRKAMKAARSLAVACLVVLLSAPALPERPHGLPPAPFEHFARALAKTWGNITSRDPSALLSALTVRAGVHTTAHVLRLKTFDDLCIPPSLKRVIKTVDTAVNLAQLVYDPNQGAQVLKTGPMQGYRVVDEQWDAKVYKPAHLVLVSAYNSSVVWVVVRGTSSAEDIFTDLTTDPEPFMDGHAHKGVLRSAEFLARRVKKVANASQQIYLTGHSLGGGAAALAALMLRNEGYSADAIAFGPPSCVSPGRWMFEGLRGCVTSLVVECDVVPRLNNDSVAALLADDGRGVLGALGALAGMLQAGLRENPPVAELLGMRLAPCGASHCPPGRLFLLERAKGEDWGVREVSGAELSDILLTPTMFSDHAVETYIRTLQRVHLRHMKQCGGSGARAKWEM